MGKLSLRPRGRATGNEGRWVRRGVVAGSLALGAGLLASVSGATGPSTDVHFTPLNPPYKIISNTGIGANATRVAVAMGGNTQVPTNATTVRFTVTVKGTKAGTLSWYPTGNPGGATGDSISWVANGTNTGTFASDIGQKNSISFKNTSLATATTTVTITGYSTEVEQMDISAIGAGDGDLLVADGLGGAGFQPAQIFADNIASFPGTNGQVLTSDGVGASSWKDPKLPDAFAFNNAAYVLLTTNFTTVASLTLPAGRYVVEAVTSGYSLGNSYFSCYLNSPNGTLLDYRYANTSTTVYNTTLTLSGLLQTTGGTVILRCVRDASSGPVEAYQSRITATRAGSLTGAVVNARTQHSTAPGSQPGR